MKYRMAIFDFDGTLADSFPWFMKVVNRLAERHGFKEIEESELETLRGYSATEMMRHLGVPAWKLPRIGSDMKKLMAEEIHDIRLFEGVGAMLRRLSERGVRLAVVTSNSYENVTRILGPENAALIDYYECGASLFGKGAKLRRVLRKSGIARAEAISIGDEIRDVEAAGAEHIPFGAVSWGYTNLAALEAHSPSEVFARIDEVAEKIA